MSRIISWFSKIGRRTKDGGRPSIEIIGRHDAAPEDSPAISILRTNGRISTEGDDGEKTAPELELGQGMRVIAQRGPRRCPICATQGKVVANGGGDGKWKCEACGSVF
jgi:hypothetical protein